MRLWSIGHSTHALDTFVGLLHAHRIEQVADVRKIPKSRRHPQFRDDALAAELPGRGIAYAHLAALGGRRHGAADGSPNTAWENRSFRAYADYAMGDEFAAGLRELEALARERRTAMMCAEALWWRCHRRLVSDRLVAAGWTVCHIDAAGAATAHELTPFARLGPDALVTYPA